MHVNVLDEPYAMRYCVETIVKNDLYFITFNIGFRIEPGIDYFFRQVVNELVDSKEVDVSDGYEQYYQESKIGDIRFLVLDSFLSFENNMPFWKSVLMKSYFTLKNISVKESVNFGLDPSNVTVEKYPMVVSPMVHPPLIRE